MLAAILDPESTQALADVQRILAKKRKTNLPVWMPEDSTAAVQGQGAKIAAEFRTE